MQIKNVFVLGMLQKQTGLDTHWVEDDANDEGTTGTSRHILCLFQLLARDLEPVATRARVVKEILVSIVGHVLELDLVVESLSPHDRRNADRAATKRQSEVV